MDNNLNDQITENSEGEEKSPSSYTDPNAGYTEAEPQAKNDNSVPKEAADDNLKAKVRKRKRLRTVSTGRKRLPFWNFGWNL